MRVETWHVAPNPDVAELCTGRREPPRTPRTAIEDVPAADYVDQLVELGPRCGESLLAFTKRMGTVRAARKLVAEVWRRYAGDRCLVASELGIPRNNIAFELRYVGLSAELLDSNAVLDVEDAPPAGVMSAPLVREDGYKRITKSLYDRMAAAYKERPTLGFVMRSAKVGYRMARKAIHQGWPHFGLPPIAAPRSQARPVRAVIGVSSQCDCGTQPSPRTPQSARKSRSRASARDPFNPLE